MERREDEEYKESLAEAIKEQLETLKWSRWEQDCANLQWEQKKEKQTKDPEEE